MKNPFRKSGDSAAIEQELRRLAGRKADAERKRSEVLQALEEARQARRDVLDADDAAIAAASGKLKALQVETTDLAELITDIDAAIEGASGRFRHAQEHEARSASAAQLDAIAAKIGDQSADFERAVKQLGKAARAMLSAIPAQVGVFPLSKYRRPEDRDERGDMASGREAVAAVLADALAAELPELFDKYRDKGYRRALFCLMDPRAPYPDFRADTPTDPLPAKDVVASLIVDRMKARAGAIRSGEAAASLDDVCLRVVAPRPQRAVELIALDNLCLVLENGIFPPKRQMLTAGTSESFPSNYAAKLVNTGAFVRSGTPEAEVFMARRQAELDARNSVAGPILWEDCRDLGDPLGLLAAEAEEAARAVG